uniref:Uncharacterized protein n=1 Tax=Magallana gigas TaxID=29159 RepID=K1S112_MAGGI
MELTESTAELEKTPRNEQSSVGKERTDKVKERHHRKKKRKHSDYDALSECRRMFRMEMMQLGKELYQFRQMCQQEVCPSGSFSHSDDTHFILHSIVYVSILLGGTSVEQYWKTKLDTLQADMTYLEKKQAQLDREQQLVDKEDELSQRLVNIESYEQEIEELESVLDRRQARCVKRQQSLQDMEEELDQQRLEIEDNKQRLEETQEKSDPSTTARKHWEIAKRGILEKQTVLESTVQKYRAELASASSNITGKDILISKLDDQVKSLHQQLDEKDKKIRNLESRLVLSIEESRKSQMSGLSDSFNSSPTRRPDSRASRGSESNSSDFSLSRSDSHRKSSSPFHQVRKSDDRFNQYHSKSDSASIRHPMRLSVDHGDDRFQMVKSPLPDKSNACVVM